MSSQKAMVNTLAFYHWDESLFQYLQVPEGVSKDDTVASILLESSEFPCVIGNFDTLKYSIGLWSRHRLPIWEHLKATTEYEYNPIENYDRREEESYTLNKEGSGSVKGDGGADTMTFDTTIATTGNETNSGSDTITNSGSDTVTNSGDDTTTRTGQDARARTESNNHTKTGNDTSTESVSAFNESNYADHTKTVTNYNTTDDIAIAEDETINRDETITLAHGKVETTAHGRTETTTHGAIKDTTGSDRKTGTETRTSLAGENRTEESTDRFNKDVYIHGNIGVTTTQQMIEQERQIADFDIVDIIVKEYINEFCIMIY